MITRVPWVSSLLIAAVQLVRMTAVSGHGFIREVVLGTVVWPGYHPFVDSYVFLVALSALPDSETLNADGGSHLRND